MTYFWPEHILFIALLRRLGGDIALTEEELERAQREENEADWVGVLVDGRPPGRGQRLRLVRQSEVPGEMTPIDRDRREGLDL